MFVASSYKITNVDVNRESGGSSLKTLQHMCILKGENPKCTNICSCVLHEFFFLNMFFIFCNLEHLGEDK